MAAYIDSSLLCNGVMQQDPYKVLTRNSQQTVYRENVNRQRNLAYRRSAVERLEESKAIYVKTEHILDSKQEFEYSCHLQVSKALHGLDLLKPSALLKTSHEAISPKAHLAYFSTQAIEQKLQELNAHQQATLRSGQGLVARPKSPAPMRMRAKSQSEIRDPQVRQKGRLTRQNSCRSVEGSSDLELRLKQLISPSSKENICCLPMSTSSPIRPDGPTRIRRGYSDPLKKSTRKSSSKLRPQQRALTSSTHKSLPNLSPVRIDSRQYSSTSSSSSFEDQKRPVYRRSRRNSDKLQPPVPEHSQLLKTYQNDHMAYTDVSSPEHPTTSQTYQVQSYRRRPIFRSKSDITYTKPKDYNQRRNSCAPNGSEKFFDLLGLDFSVWCRLTSPDNPPSPPLFFESGSSVDSENVCFSYSSTSSSTSSRPTGLCDSVLKELARSETSIVEKNARVIKWLYNCRKAQDLDI